MKQLIRHILRESQTDPNLVKLVNMLSSKFGANNVLDASISQLEDLENDEPGFIRNQMSKKLYDIGVTSKELSKVKDILQKDYLADLNQKSDEYIQKYGQNPKLAKERFLKDIISEIKSKSLRVKIYNDFLKKLSDHSGEKTENRYSDPEKSTLLLKLAKFIEEPSDTPKTRGEFLKRLQVPRGHYSTTFSRLVRNGLIKTIKKDGKKVYELGPNFDKFINGDPPFTGDMEKLFDDYISEYGFSLDNFYNQFKPLFYYDSDYIKFVKSFRDYVDNEDHLRLSLLMNRNKNK